MGLGGSGVQCCWAGRLGCAGIPRKTGPSRQSRIFVDMPDMELLLVLFFKVDWSLLFFPFSFFDPFLFSLLQYIYESQASVPYLVLITYMCRLKNNS
jgi:hypothetical protein